MGTIGSGKSTTAKALAKYLSVDQGYTVVIRSYAQELKEAVGKVLPAVYGTQEEKSAKVLITEDMADELLDQCFKLAYNMSEAIYETPEEAEYFVDKVGEDFAWIPMRNEYWSARDLLIEISDSFRFVNADCFHEYSKHQEANLKGDIHFIIYDDARHFREIAKDGNRDIVNVFLNDVNGYCPTYPSTEVPSEYISALLKGLTVDVCSGDKVVENISVILGLEEEAGHQSNFTVIEVCDVCHKTWGADTIAKYIYHDIYDEVDYGECRTDPYHIEMPKHVACI